MKGEPPLVQARVLVNSDAVKSLSETLCVAPGFRLVPAPTSCEPVVPPQAASFCF